MKKSYITLAFLVVFTLGCSMLTPPMTSITSESYVHGPPINMVRVTLREYPHSGNFDSRSAAGVTQILEASFDPIEYINILRPDGGVAGHTDRPWESPNIAEMRSCFSASNPCQPEGDWQPFAMKQQFPVLVDWLGLREFLLVKEFRDPSGNPIPAFYSPSNDLMNAVYWEITGYWVEATPIGNQPEWVQTAIAATQTAFPVTGSVELEGGNCCAGGTVGGTIGIDVEFAAASPNGQVTEMRVSRAGCLAEADMSEATWEPFVASKMIPIYVSINWVGFYISVQYRDEQGHLSPVYCDDISVEGMIPPEPLPTP